MAEVNTSIYAIPPNNSLQQAGQAIGAANALETNKLLRGSQVQQQTQIDTSKLELAQKQLGAFRNLLAPLINKPDITHNDISEIGIKAVQQKLATPQQVITELANLPRNSSPQELQKYVQNLYVQQLGHSDQINMMLGTVQGVGGPGGTTLIQQPQLPNRPSRQVGQVASGLAPGQQVYNPATRQMELVTQGQPGTFQPSRQPGGTGGGMPMVPGGGGPAAPGKLPQTTPGRLPAAAPLGEAEAATQTAAGSGQSLQNEYGHSAQYAQQVFPLEQAIPALQRLGKTGTGPGTETINQIKSFAMSMGMPGVNEKGIVDFDKAKKYLTDFVNQTGNSGTNDKLAAAFAGNPSVNISNAAAVDVAKAALALRRMREARLRAFDAKGLPEKDFSKFASQWNRDIDPRVFGFDLMNAKQRQAVLESLPKGKRDKFMFDLQQAEEGGLLRPPAEMPPQTKKK